MSTTQIVDATTTEQHSGSEPQTMRKRTYVVKSERRALFTVGDLVDFAKAVTKAEAPFSTVLRFDRDSTDHLTIVAEWHHTIDEKDEP